jgi:hypothetical protein
MRIVDDIILLLGDAARAGSACALLAVAQAARKICLMAGLMAGALVMLLGALGLMLAAVVIGLAPHLGAHWAAMIAATAALAGAGGFLAVARMVSRGR